MLFTHSVVESIGYRWLNTAKDIKNAHFRGIETAGGSLYGIWFPYFGMPSNTLIVMHVFSQEPDGVVNIVRQSLEEFNGIASAKTRLMLKC